MTIDISKIKPGDKVTLVPLEVAAVNSLRNEISTYAGGKYLFFSPDQIAAHHPKPREFQVGDRVWISGDRSGEAWEVEHIAHKRAWLSQFDGGRARLWPLDDLTLVEGGE